MKLQKIFLLFFLLSLLNILFINKLFCGINAEITLSSISPVVVGNSVTISYTVKNTGNVSHSFGVGCDIKQSSVLKASLPGKTTTTISPGSSQSGSFTYTIPSNWSPATNYSAYVVVWSGAAGMSDWLDNDEKNFTITCGDNAELISSIPPTGISKRGESHNAVVRIKNTGTTTRKFWIGLSFAEEWVDLNNDSWPDGWYDIMPKETDILSPGMICDVSFSFIIPHTLPPGIYTARTAIWDGYNIDKHEMKFPRFDKKDVQSFTLEAYPEPAGDLLNQIIKIIEVVNFDNIKFGDMRKRYIGEINGKCEKPLLYMSVSAKVAIPGVPIPIEAGGSLLIDLADVFSITPEGNGDAEYNNSQWVTCWVDAEGGIASINTKLGFDMGLIVHQFDYGENALADYRKEISGGQAQFAFFTFSGLRFEPGTGFEKPRFQIITNFDFKVEATIKAKGLVGLEINKQFIYDAFAVTNFNDLKSLTNAIIDFITKGNNEYFRNITEDDGNRLLDIQGDRITNLKCHIGGHANYFFTEVPEGLNELRVRTDNVGAGNADIYIQRGTRPTLESYFDRSIGIGNEENISIPNPQPGIWYIMVYATSPYDFVALYGTPVELSYFSYNLKMNSVELVWATESETDNYGFEIERKRESEYWEKIGFIQGNGTTNVFKKYFFTDHSKLEPGNYFYRLKQIDTDGTFEYSSEIKVLLDLPKEYKLSNNYPNPFNPETIINYQLPKSVHVEIKIYNTLGQEIRTLLNEKRNAGYHQVIWDGKDNSGKTVSTGTYLYQMKTNDFVEVKKMTFIQ